MTQGPVYRTSLRPQEIRMAQRIRKGDLVQVVAGDDRGKQGRVIAVDLERGKVRVEKVRMHKRHLKAGRKGARHSLRDVHDDDV